MGERGRKTQAQLGNRQHSSEFACCGAASENPAKDVEKSAKRKLRRVLKPEQE